MSSATTTTTFPVIEIFGPTIQGEGALAGAATKFVRFGGCDYRCSWCDSMYAVEPSLVREHATKMTGDEIVEALGSSPMWVTLSGGNPALFKLGKLVRDLQAGSFRVAVETQGSRWRDWLGDVDCLTVSPKPPSSGMTTLKHLLETTLFMQKADEATKDEYILRNQLKRALKLVVFNDEDYDFAANVIREWREWPAYLSVGTDQPDPATAHLSVSHTEAVRGICDRYRWLCEKVAADPAMRHVRVLPQLHVLAWGHARGV